MTKLSTIEVFSDVVCPWCFIGTRRLEKVLSARGIADAVTLTYRTFLLDPSTPEGGINVPEMLKRKYGRDPAPMFARVEAEARSTGIPLVSATQPMMYPTVRAHTVLRHAVPLGTQRALAQALFEANFLAGKNIADVDVLGEIAAAHGFTAERAKELVSDPGEIAKTMDEAKLPLQLGIGGAPFFVFEQKFAVSGAQPEDVFSQVLDEIAAQD